MKRRQLFEFGDQSWYPQFLKDMLTDYLNFVIKRFKLHQPVIPLLADLLKESKESRIIDLCSGGGGGMVDIGKMLQEAYKEDFTITLTDKYPNLPAFEKIAGEAEGKIDYLETSVSAHTLPENLQGLRTIFNAFHHFPPPYAKDVLRDAVEKNNPIAIFEIMERKFANIFPPLVFIPVFVLLFTPFIRPFKISRLIFTYLIPIVPLSITWDGIVSALRSYKPEELLAIAEEAGGGKYRWKAGLVAGTGPNSVTYLTGVPLSQNSN